MSRQRTLSDADSRRESIVEAALTVFAKAGFASTPVTAVAAAAGISQAYVFKLFPSKEGLFVAALERCFERVEETLVAGADAADSTDPDVLLSAMGEAYARLITDRDVLMIQVHAQSAADIVPVRDALRRGLARIVRLARERTGASDAAVQHFVAYGQLCHLIVTAGLTELDDDWAKTLWEGIRHFD